MASNTQASPNVARVAITKAPVCGPKHRPQQPKGPPPGFLAARKSTSVRWQPPQPSTSPPPPPPPPPLPPPKAAKRRRVVLVEPNQRVVIVEPPQWWKQEPGYWDWQPRQPQQWAPGNSASASAEEWAEEAEDKDAEKADDDDAEEWANEYLDGAEEYDAVGDGDDAKKPVVAAKVAKEPLVPAKQKPVSKRAKPKTGPKIVEPVSKRAKPKTGPKIVEDEDQKVIRLYLREVSRFVLKKEKTDKDDKEDPGPLADAAESVDEGSCQRAANAAKLAWTQSFKAVQASGKDPTYAQCEELAEDERVYVVLKERARLDRWLGRFIGSKFEARARLQAERKLSAVTSTAAKAKADMLAEFGFQVDGLDGSAWCKMRRSGRIVRKLWQCTL